MKIIKLSGIFIMDFWICCELVLTDYTQHTDSRHRDAKGNIFSSLTSSYMILLFYIPS